jgi:hypothetical protein
MAQTDVNELLDRYAMLRDTLLGLEAEKEALGKALKAALQEGQVAQSALYRAELRTSQTTEYPLDRFRQVFGDAAALEVSTIDRKKADALAQAGDLDGDALASLAVRRDRTPSLVLVPV